MVKQQRREGVVDPNIAVQIYGLTKTHPGTKIIGGCKCKKKSPYRALKVYENSLAWMRLTKAAKMRVSSYSSGMKCCLSVAAALIGDPKLVILDEPTTGMDPVMRRHVWDAIKDAKEGCAIFLMSRSIEEAEILGDRIGIMTKGRLHYLGTSSSLKSCFGIGFVAHVSFIENTNRSTCPNEDAVAMPHEEAVKQFFKLHLDVVPKDEDKGFLTFFIPYDREVRLTKFFNELQEKEEEFQIANIDMGHSSLEEVFVNIVKEAELESAAMERSLDSR